MVHKKASDKASQLYFAIAKLYCFRSYICLTASDIANAVIFA